MIEAYLEFLEQLPDPLREGKLLTGDWSGCYSFKVKKYRIIAEPFEEYLLIEVIRIDHRDSVYD